MSVVPLPGDPGDPRIAGYLRLRDKDVAREDGAFVAEGANVLEVLLSPRPTGPVYRPRSILMAESRLGPLAPLVDRAGALGVPVYVAPQPLMDRIVGFPIHRGVLALVDRPVAVSPTELPRHGGGTTWVVLLGVVNHDNVGGLFRNAAAFGVDGVLLDSVSCDPLYRKALRVSVGGVLRVPFARAASQHDAVDAVVSAGLTPIALSPHARRDVRTMEWPSQSALILGTEGRGLDAEVLARCEVAGIPMANGFDSLNVATACGVALAMRALSPGCARAIAPWA